MERYSIRHDGLGMHPQSGGDWCAYSVAQREIDSLRLQLQASHAFAGQLMEERYEWKRRATELWSISDELSQEELFALTQKSYDLLESASEWFEEE